MRTIITTLALTGTLAIGLCACSAETKETTEIPGTEVDAVEVETVCVCDAGKAGETVWCDACGKGYIDGKETGCEACVKAKLGGPACPT